MISTQNDFIAYTLRLKIEFSYKRGAIQNQSSLSRFFNLPLIVNEGKVNRKGGTKWQKKV